MFYKAKLNLIIGAVFIGICFVVLVRHTTTKSFKRISSAWGLEISFVNVTRPEYTPFIIVPSLDTAIARAKTVEKENSVDCLPGVPCRYPEVVDLRIIIITFYRAKSLLLLLNSLEKLELDGDLARMEIWVDRSSIGKVSNETLAVAEKFKWSRGKVRVHVQQKNVGVYGQSIDTWTPNVNSKKGLNEIALIIEDDMLVSPFAYRWLKAVHRYYGQNPEFFGATLTSDIPGGHQIVKPRLFSQTNVTVFYHKFTGTWGTSPSPRHWVGFQSWFHKVRNTVPKFKPYIPESTGCRLTQIYKQLDRGGRAHTMWDQWLNFYVYQQKLFTIYNNIEMYNNGSRTSCLSINRRAAGMHFKSWHEKKEHYCKLLTTWNPDFITFPKKTPYTDWNGTIITTY